MNDEILSADSIFLQDIVCSVVCQFPKEDNIALYNKIVPSVDIKDIDDVDKILRLIELNKLAILT